MRIDEMPAGREKSRKRYEKYVSGVCQHCGKEFSYRSDKNLSGKEPNFETTEDTWKDIAGYAILALIELREGR